MCSTTTISTDFLVLLLSTSIIIFRSDLSLTCSSTLSLSLSVEVSLLLLMLLKLQFSVEKIFTSDNVVVCKELRLKSAEVDMIFFELVLVELTQRVMSVVAMGACVLRLLVLQLVRARLLLLGGLGVLHTATALIVVILLICLLLTHDLYYI